MVFVCECAQQSDCDYSGGAERVKEDPEERCKLAGKCERKKVQIFSFAGFIIGCFIGIHAIKVLPLL